jgi:hypothetical protein
MSQFRRTPDGLIDHAFYRRKANRLRRAARSRFVALAVAAICFPFTQTARLARRWQATWPSPPVVIRPEHRFSLARVRSLFW